MTTKYECTIIIPTFNRPDELTRALSYYDKYGGGNDIVVADSSSDDNKKINRKTILSLPNLNVLYISYYRPTINPYHKIADALTHVNTKYSVLCADDDFVTSAGINKATHFLEHNSDFTAAYGYYLSFHLKNKKNGDKKFCWAPGLHKSNTFGLPTTRLTEHFSNGPSIIFYATYRTNFLKMIFKETMNFTDEYVFGETLPTSLALIYGKIECLDVLYCARETPIGSKKRKNTLLSFVTDQSYDVKYDKFRKCLLSHLSEKSELSEMELIHIIDDNMAVFIERRCPAKYANILHHKLRPCLKILDYMSKGCRASLRKLIASVKSKEMHVEDYQFAASVSEPSSKYNEDFNNIRTHVLSNPESQKPPHYAPKPL